MNETSVLRSKVPPQYSGYKLLDYLSARFRYQTAEAWNELIRNGKISVNDRTAGPELLLTAKDTIAYTVILNEPPVNKDIRIIHEEGTFLIAYKPPHLPSHADGNYIKNTFIYLLNQGLSDRGWKGKAQLVHRLDRETSGLMLVAKEKKVVSSLALQFEKGLVEKQYLAIVRGVMPADAEVSGSIVPDTKSSISIRQKLVPIDGSNPKNSTTIFKTMKVFNGYSLVECRPKTGRTNQIRIHLDSIDHPIVGDKLYGRTDEQFLEFVHAVKQGSDPMNFNALEASRQFLHASRLTFVHPETSQKVTYSSELPDDMRLFIEKHT